MEDLRTARLTKRNEKDRERAKHAVDIEDLRTARLTKRNEKDRERRAKHAVDIENRGQLG